MTEPAKAPFWSQDVAGTFAALASSPSGLTTPEVERRRALYGPNVAVASLRRSVLAKLARKLAEPLVAILLVAAAVSGATGDWQSFVILLVIVFLSIALDIVQEQKAEAAVEALKSAVAVTASVCRDGAAVELPVRELVPGDVVELRAGDLVPADGLLLSGRDPIVNEAALTGEPYPVEKRPGATSGPSPADATGALFAGTSLVGGDARMLVVATGGATRFGAISASLQSKVAPTSFERGIHALGMLILRLTGFLVLFVLLTQLARTGLTLESFLFAVALAVGLTPELLPMVMTVTLSRGAVRMAARKVVVKRLSAIHDLGAMDVLCTDKTGTLTKAEIALVETLAPDGAVSASVGALAQLNARFARGTRNNLDAAILAGTGAPDTRWTLLDDLPFDFERRRSSVLVSDGTRRLMVVKGAPEGVLAACDRREGADGAPVPLDGAARAAAQAILEAKGQEGFRLLALAWREVEGDHVTLDDEARLVLAGFAVFLDPPKETAGAAVARLMAAGVRVKIISGDAEPVVRHVAGSLKCALGGVLTGEEIEALPETALAARVGSTDIFVRVSPDQKMRIVRALRRRGHTVGFLGDGINDAPAIHAADVGLSVDGGTEVAREAADIILLAPDLGVLADGVEEGRRTYANIMKYVRMGTSSNFGNMLSMAFASLLLPFLPLAPLQILLNNLIYDVSEIGIPFDGADPEDLARPHAWDMGSVLRFTLVMGPLSSLFDMATFALLRLGFQADVEVFRTAWFVESIATQILVIFVIRTARPFWKSRPNAVLAATSLGALAVALALALTPIGAFLGFVPLQPAMLGAIALVSVAYLVLAERLKPLALRAGRYRGGRHHGGLHHGMTHRF